MHKGNLLLGIRKRRGWCIPCGYVEWDEPTETAAIHEATEETRVDVELKSVFAVHSNPQDPERHTVGV